MYICNHLVYLLWHHVKEKIEKQKQKQKKRACHAMLLSPGA